MGEVGGHRRMDVDHRAGGYRAQCAQYFGAARGDDVAAEQHPGAAGGNAHRMDVVGPFGDADVGDHGAVLLRQADLVEHGHTFALQVRRHAEQGADGHDAGAADPGDDDAIGSIDGRKDRIGERREIDVRGAAGRSVDAAAVDGDEARAEPVEAGEILVARRLVDGAFAAIRRLLGNDGDAVGLDAAVAAALAHRLVDEGALRRVGIEAALAAAAFLGGAGLVVDEDGGASIFAQLPLHRVEVVAVGDGDARGEGGPGAVFLRLVGDHHDPRHALGGDLAGDHRHVERAVHRLAAGHRHRVVVRGSCR